MNNLILAIILTLIPVTELRVGLPLAIIYAIDNNIPVFLIFFLIVLINILLIFFIFFFLDHLHATLMNIKIYEKTYSKFLKKFQRKVDKLEKRHTVLGFLSLTLFVAIPLPGTGAWTGTLAAWILGLDRKKSILAISLGVLIAGTVILFGTLGFMKLFGF